MKLCIALNKNGRRIGETHHNAKLTDDDVNHIRLLNIEHGISFRELARKFEVSHTTIENICGYKKRCQVAEKFKTIEVGDGKNG